MLRTIKSLIHYKLRFNYYFDAQLREVLAQKQWSDARLADEQNERFLATVQRALRHSSFYQKRYAEYGVSLGSIRSIDDIKTLPIITKHDVRAHQRSIYIGHRWIRSTGRTSGTSGTPLEVFRDYRSIVQEGAYLWAQRAMFGFCPGMNVISLRGNLDRSTKQFYDRYTNCLHLSSFNLRAKYARWYYEKIQQFQPYAILAYPSSVEILANLFRARNLRVKVPYIFTSSEQVYEHQREKVEEIFNTRVVDWYGNAERSIALEQRPDGHYYELPLYSVNEYEEQRVITTGLTTPSFPLIRYQVDDVVVPGTTKTTHRIDTIMGRHDDVLVLPDGTRIGRIGAVFLDIKGLELAQIHQREAEHFLLRLVVNKDFTRRSLEKIRSGLRQKAGHQLNYDVVYTQEEDIVRSPAGKYKLVMNSLSDNRIA